MLRFIKVIFMICFFVCSIIFFVQNLTTLSQPLALRFDPLPTFSKVEAGEAPAAEIAALGQPPATAGVPTESFLAWRSDGVPMYIVVLASFVVGVFFASMFFIVGRIRHAYIIVGNKRRIRNLDSELKRIKVDLAKTQEKAKANFEALERAKAKELPAAEDTTIETTAETKA